MNKKAYEAPVVIKVSLEVKNSVLAVCRSSTVVDAGDTCRYVSCYVGAPIVPTP